MKVKRNFLSIILILILIIFLVLLSLRTPLIKEFINNDCIEIVNTESVTEFSVDKDYNNKKQNIKSNAELTNLNEEFANIWKGKTEIYYQSIYEYYYFKDDTAMIDKIESMKVDWENYYSNQMNYYKDFILSKYTTGSIVPVKLSEYSKALYRNKALELYDLCLDLGIDVDSP